MINGSGTISPHNHLLNLNAAKKAKIMLLRYGEKNILRVENSIVNSGDVYACEQILKANDIEYELKATSIADMDELNKNYVEANEDVDDKSAKSIGLALEIFEAAAAKNASDIHFEVKDILCNIFFRIDGKVRFYKEISGEIGKRRARTIFNWMCADLNHGQFLPTAVCEARLLGTDVDKFGLSGGRLSSRPTKDGFKMVIRLFKTRSGVIDMAELGLLPEQKTALERAIRTPSGVVIFSGPMGSGKSTLAQIICELLKREDPGKNILTVENPIEYPMEGITQTALLPGESWSDALATIVRQDVNVFLFGEIRDSLSALGVIDAAETGHFVITSMHSNEAIQTLSRLKGLGVPPDLLTNPSLLVALVGQRLAPLLCDSCKVPYLDALHSPELAKYAIDENMQNIIETHCEVDKIFVTSKCGCVACEEQGIKGRTGVFEIVETSHELFRIYKAKDEIAAYQYWLKKGGISLCAATTNLINQGRLDPVLAHRDICNLNRDHIYTNLDALDS